MDGITAAAALMPVVTGAFKTVKNIVVKFYVATMLKYFPNWYISRLCKRVDRTTRREQLQELALCLCERLAILNDNTYRLAENAFKFYPACQLFETVRILNLGNELASNHPAWRLLSLMVEHTEATTRDLRNGDPIRVMEADIPDMVANLQRLKDRLLNGDFTTMRPFALVVWIQCRLKTNVPPSESTRFPKQWKDIMKRDIQSTDLASTSNTKMLLLGNIDMIFCMN